MGECVEMVEQLSDCVGGIRCMGMRRYHYLRLIVYKVIFETVKLKNLFDFLQFLLWQATFAVFNRRQKTGADLKKIRQLFLAHSRSLA